MRVVCHNEFPLVHFDNLSLFEILFVGKMTRNFNGKVAIVTGSSNGIGRCTAQAMAAQGAKVVLIGRDTIALREAERECLSSGVFSSDVMALAGDLTDDDFLKNIVDSTIERFGKIDILEGFAQSIETFDKNFQLNLRSIFHLIQLSFPHLEKTGGCIVNVSSIMSLAPHGNMSMPYYAICKAGLDHMSRSMALEYIKKGVRVNTVNPGLISTPFFTKLGVSVEKVKLMESYVSSNPNWIPAGRTGKPEDIKNAILFLADNNLSSYVVGQSLVVCGGASICMGLDTSDYKTPMA